MQRYPVLYGRSRKVKLRRRRIALFFLVSLLLLIIGIGVNTVSYFNRMTDRDRWAASLKRGVEEAARQNYLLLLVQGEEENRELASLYLLSSHGENPYGFVLPANSTLERGGTFRDAYEAKGTSGAVEAFIEFMAEPVHYYLLLEEGLFAALGELQGLRSRAPRAYYPVRPGVGINQLVGEVQNWERDALSFAQELLVETPFWRWPVLIRETLGFYETNLNWREVNALMKAADGYVLPPGRAIHLLPGEWTETEAGETPLYMVDPQRLEAFLEYMRVGRSRIAREDIRVEVLNGSGVPGVARRTATYLKEEGFQVVRVDDADHFDYTHTQVISRLDDVTPAKEVAILIRGAQLIRETLPYADAMVTVILGKDFDLDRIFQQ